MYTVQAFAKAVAAANDNFIISGQRWYVLATDGRYVTGQIALLSGGTALSIYIMNLALGIIEGYHIITLCCICFLLRSTVYLEVALTATIIGVQDSTQYPTDPNAWGLIYANGAQQIGVVGGGTIDGNFTAYIRSYGTKYQPSHACGRLVAEAEVSNSDRIIIDQCYSFVFQSFHRSCQY